MGNENHEITELQITTNQGNSLMALSFKYEVVENADNDNDEFRVCLFVEETVTKRHWTNTKNIEETNTIKISPLSDYLDYEKAIKLKLTLEEIAKAY